jgi:hypothetical protein
VLSGNYTPPEPTGRASRVTASNKTRAITFAAVKVSREQVLEATHKVSRKAAAREQALTGEQFCIGVEPADPVEDAVGKRQKRCSKPLWADIQNFGARLSHLWLAQANFHKLLRDLTMTEFLWLDAVCSWLRSGLKLPPSSPERPSRNGRPLTSPWLTS